jgi:hypothetical protein
MLRRLEVAFGEKIAERVCARFLKIIGLAHGLGESHPESKMF